MAEKPVLDFKNSAEHDPPNAGAADSPMTWGHDLDPQQVTLAARAICNSEHDVHCGLSIVPNGRAPETIAATDDVPVRVDWLQHELRQGPGLDADPGEVLAIKDLAAAERWLDFGRMCVAVLNLRSMVSIRIPTDSPDRAMLNFYSSEPSAFDHMDVDAALRIARLAAPAVRTITDEFREPLQETVNGDCSRVAVAVGTVMARYRVNSADAFGLLREASGYLRRSLLGVAIDVVADVRLLEEAVIQARRQRRARPGRERAQPGAPPEVGSEQPARLPPAVHSTPSIGGPDMWHDPSAPPARPAGPVPGKRVGAGRRSRWRPVLPA